MLDQIIFSSFSLAFFTFFNLQIKKKTQLFEMQLPHLQATHILPTLYYIAVFLLLSPIAHVMTSCPLVAMCKRNGASTVGLLPSNWCTSSQLPLCETGESGEDGPAMCWSRQVWAGVITYCLSPSKTYEGDLCLPYCEGMLTARQRVADGEMQPIFSPQPERLLKV